MEIDTGKIEMISSEIEKLSNSLSEELSKMESTIQSMKENWDTNESKTFFDSISGKYFEELKQLINNLNSFQKFISYVPGSYSLLDEDYGNKEIDV